MINDIPHERKGTNARIAVDVVRLLLDPQDMLLELLFVLDTRQFLERLQRRSFLFQGVETFVKRRLHPLVREDWVRHS